jgi:predicted transcriptional regulator
MSKGITDQEVLEAVKQHEPAATREVGEALGIVRSSADYRLRQLRDEGMVKSKKVGRELVWMIGENQDHEFE